MRKIFQLIQRNLLSEKTEAYLRLRKKLPIITISRERGSGGRPIAYLVAKKLGPPWEVYHKQIIDDITKQTRLEKELISQVDEKQIPMIERILLDTLGKKYSTLSNYYKHLLRVLSAVGNRGHAIIIGRGANFLFSKSLNVRIICTMPQRIAWMMEYEKMTREEAILDLDRSDLEREEYNRVLFHHSVKKAHHYDLIVRTGRNVSIEDAADIIVCAAKKRFQI